MYKMIVSDLDGTLLNDYKEVSKENIELIKRAYSEKGIITVIATGRPFGYEIFNLYGNCFSDYIIACDGAIIKNSKTNKCVHKVAFTNQEILKLRKIYLEEDTDYMMLNTEEETIKEVKDLKINLQDTGADIGNNKSKIENIEELVENNPNMTKLLCVVGSANTEALEKVIKKISHLKNIETTDISKYIYKTEKSTFEAKYIDIMKKGCSKKNAIHILADKLGIKQEEIIVIGDSGNDISMFESAGLKIAMENAEDYLKEKADFITASNNDSGVAKAIQKFIFEGE